MNGSRAKALRRAIYGSDLSPRARRYGRLGNGQVVADERRRAYQRLKRGHRAALRGEGDVVEQALLATVHRRPPTEEEP